MRPRLHAQPNAPWGHPAAAPAARTRAADHTEEAVRTAVAAQAEAVVRTVLAAKAAEARAADPVALVDRAEDRAAASASIFARRKSAASAWSAWISSITRKPKCCSRSCRSAERFCRGASPEPARAISAGWARPLSARATSHCCRLPRSCNRPHAASKTIADQITGWNFDADHFAGRCRKAGHARRSR
jgi:hypothetical protein